MVINFINFREFFFFMNISYVWFNFVFWTFWNFRFWNHYFFLNASIFFHLVFFTPETINNSSHGIISNISVFNFLFFLYLNHLFKSSYFWNIYLSVILYFCSFVRFSHICFKTGSDMFLTPKPLHIFHTCPYYASFFFY